MNFADRLSKLIHDSGRSHERLAAEVGCTHATIGSWRRGKTEPRISEAVRLAEVLGADPDWLVFGRDRRSPELTDAEVTAVRMVRAQRLDADEVIRRLATPSMPARPPVAEVPVQREGEGDFLAGSNRPSGRRAAGDF